jgi:hypothetical protein
VRQFVAAVVLLVAARAHAEAPRKPGPETLALKTFFRSVTWSGKAGAATTRGKSTCGWILDGLFAACEMEESSGGKPAWKGHFVVGWDVDAKEYRAVMVDNGGSVGMLAGKLDGKKLVLASPGESSYLGKPTRFRLTWDASDGAAIRFTEELAVAGGAFTVGEEATMKPE